MVFHEIILHTELHRLDGDRFVAMTGDEHDGRRQLVTGRRGGEKFQTGDVGQAEVEQDAIERPRAQCRDSGGAVGGVMDLKLLGGLARQQPAIQAPVSLIVVDDEQTIDAFRVRHDAVSPWDRDTRRELNR